MTGARKTIVACLLAILAVGCGGAHKPSTNQPSDQAEVKTVLRSYLHAQAQGGAVAGAEFRGDVGGFGEGELDAGGGDFAGADIMKGEERGTRTRMICVHFLAPAGSILLPSQRRALLRTDAQLARHRDG